MKGVVFDLLEQVVTRDHGADVWDDLLQAASLDGAYTSLGSYPDEDLYRLVSAASTAFDVPSQDVIRWFGREALPLLAAAYPRFFQPHITTRTFIGTLNDIIHPEVRKVYPGADVPWFDMAEGPSGEIAMGYTSQRRLCAFAEGLIEGAAAYFDEHVSIDQPACMLRGDEACQLVVRLG